MKRGRGVTGRALTRMARRAARGDLMLSCVSRAAGDSLVIDL
jgi:hypothetical protein